MGLIRSIAIVPMLISLLVVPSVAVMGDECEDCHSSSGGSGGYDFKPALLVVSKPLVCGPGEDIMVRLYIVPTSVYSIKGIEAQLFDEDGQAPLQGQWSMDPEGQGCYEWAIASGSGPLKQLVLSCIYVCHYDHSGPGNKDDAEYSLEVRTDLNVVSSSMRMERDLVFIAEGCSVRLNALGEISDMDVAISSSLQGKVSATLDRTALQEGGSANLALNPLSDGAMDGYLNVSWTESGVQRHAYLRVLRVRPRTAIGTDLYHEIGKYTGIAAFVLLAIGYFTGGTGSLKIFGNKIFRSAARRTRFHCALSYEVLILVVFHLLVLWYGPYRELIWIWEVVLGEIALAIMLIIALNGIFQRKLVPTIGYQNWRRVHAWGTYLATGLVVVHMLTNGTHFLWFRQLIGMV